MSASKRSALWIACVAVLGWILTWTYGRAAVTRHIFNASIYKESYETDPSRYGRYPEGAQIVPPAPRYSLSTWSPFPFVIVSRYWVDWREVTTGDGESRVFLWLCGPLIQFQEYDVGSS